MLTVVYPLSRLTTALTMLLLVAITSEVVAQPPAMQTNRKLFASVPFQAEGQVWETVRNPSGSYNPYYVERLNKSTSKPKIMSPLYTTVIPPGGGEVLVYNFHYHEFEPDNTSSARRGEVRANTNGPNGIVKGSWTAGSIGGPINP